MHVHLENVSLAFLRTLYHNINVICEKILRPLSDVFISALQNVREEDLLKDFFKVASGIGTCQLSIPRDVMALGILRGTIEVRAGKTHMRYVKICDPQYKGRLKKMETSDIVFLVSYRYAGPQLRAITIDERILFIQAKLEHGRKFEIPAHQWLFMRFWPVFKYGGETFNLHVCRKFPDLCSFFLFILRNTFVDNLSPVAHARLISHCVNAEVSSVLLMQNAYPSLGANSTVRVSRMPVARGIFSFLWRLLIMRVGVHDLRAVDFMKKLFPQLFSSTNGGQPTEEAFLDERPVIGVHIVITMWGEEEVIKKWSKAVKPAK